MHSIRQDIIKSFFPDNNFLSNGVGKCGVIIAAPHGGGIRPFNMPNRTYGRFTRDTYTRRITEKLIDSLSVAPYYIYADIHRIKVDLNRDIEEGAQGNPVAENIWKSWNIVTETYISDALRKYKKVLYVDIHSQNNTKNIQLGYGISAKSYLELMSRRRTLSRSTMYGLYKNQFDTIFGEDSFSQSLKNLGFDVYIPKTKEEYFSGGRNIRQFSGHNVGTVQVEVPVSMAKENLDAVSLAVKYAIENFAERYLNYDFKNKNFTGGQ